MNLSSLFLVYILLKQYHQGQSKLSANLQCKTDTDIEKCGQFFFYYQPIIDALQIFTMTVTLTNVTITIADMLRTHLACLRAFNHSRIYKLSNGHAANM